MTKKILIIEHQEQIDFLREVILSFSNKNSVTISSYDSMHKLEGYDAYFFHLGFVRDDIIKQMVLDKPNLPIKITYSGGRFFVPEALKHLYYEMDETTEAVEEVLSKLEILAGERK